MHIKDANRNHGKFYRVSKNKKMCLRGEGYKWSLKKNKGLIKLKLRESFHIKEKSPECSGLRAKFLLGSFFFGYWIVMDFHLDIGL